MEWAVKFSAPDPDFEQAVLSMPPWELEEYFQVDSDFIAFKLKLKKDQLLQVMPGVFPILPGESIPAR